MSAALRKKLIGVTGGIGSGKSLVCRFIESFGFKVFYADAVAKQLYKVSGPLKKKLQLEFGRDIIRSGSVSKTKLRQILLKSRQNEFRVNRIVHPFVISEILKQAAKVGSNLAFVEAALIFESGFDKYLDFVILVHSSRALRMKLTLKRGVLNREQIEKIMKLQMPEPEKIRRADFVIHNNSGKQVLKQKVVRLLKQYFIDGK